LTCSTNAGRIVVDRAAAELRATGGTTRARSPPPLGHLAPQEQLAADGLTNTEIAAPLFLSPDHRLPPAQSVHQARDRLRYRAGSPGTPPAPAGLNRKTGDFADANNVRLA
jgi:hypothetical protein